jgi:two-component system cell cycle sensor histidine kinase/response regulator CckA
MVRLTGNDIELDIEYEKDVWPVKVDVGQFEQVMVNLAVNARDAMKKSGKLTISTKNLLIDSSFNQKEYYTPIGDEKIVPGEYVLVSIKDNGTGIPLGILDKIFEPFFSTKDASSGTGLGLATVFGIIKQTGGYIRIKTEESIGTTFYIFLRAATLLEDRPEKIKEMNTSEDGMQNIISDRVETTISKLTGKKNRVLIVEDENAVRLFNSHALKTKGYEVLEADCAETAIEVLSNCNGEVDLILTDVIMPGMSGPELAEQVSKQYPDIKFIFTSGYAEDAVSYLSDKNSHFLEKPYTLKELINKVMKVLSSVKEV